MTLAEVQLFFLDQTAEAPKVAKLVEALEELGRKSLFSSDLKLANFERRRSTIISERTSFAEDLNPKL